MVFVPNLCRLDSSRVACQIMTVELHLQFGKRKLPIISHQDKQGKKVEIICKSSFSFKQFQRFEV